MFVYINAAWAETKGTMGKYDPNIGGVGMGFEAGAGVGVGHLPPPTFFYGFSMVFLKEYIIFRT